MTLFGAVIQQNSLSLLSFLFLTHVQFFSSKIYQVCHLKYSYIFCFFPNFCFLAIVDLLVLVLLVFFPIAVISLSLFFSL